MTTTTATRHAFVASGETNQMRKIEIPEGVITRAHLEPLLKAVGFTLDKVDIIVNPGKVTLGSPDSLIPASGDFRVYLVPTKNEAGLSPEKAKALGDEITAALIKAAAKASDEDVSTLKDSIVEEIEVFFNVTLEAEVPDTDKAELEATLEEARNFRR